MTCDKTVIVEDYRHKKFKVDLMEACPGLRFKEVVGFKSVGGTGLSCLGPGDDLIRNETAASPRCVISKVEPYNPEMEHPRGRVL